MIKLFLITMVFNKLQNTIINYGSMSKIHKRVEII
jgi:hypothetical protein